MSSRPAILLTGSSGTVGTALALRLREDGYQVHPLDIKANLWDDDIDRRTIRHDLGKPLDKLRLPRLPDVIVHLAANARVHDLVERPQLALDNYVMTHNVLEYARAKGIRRVLFSSSREVYGESRRGIKRREDDTHVSRIKAPYTASKFAAEAMIHAWAECYDTQPVIARLSNVYGRYDVSERVIPLFLYYALRDRDITVFGKEKRLDFTYIDDCIDGLARIIKRFDQVSGKTFNLATGRGERLVDLAKWIIDLLDSQSEVHISDKRVGEISSFVGNITAAQRLLGYKPTTTLKRGLVPSIDWYIEAMKDRRAYESQRRNLAKRGWL
jgi:UDP-glucose 4-epimerase